VFDGFLGGFLVDFTLIRHNIINKCIILEKYIRIQILSSYSLNRILCHFKVPASRLRNMPQSSLMPEFFALLGIDVFLAISLISCLLDSRFPKAIPYIYQVAALFGFAQLLVSKEFIAIFGDYMRFWYSLIYLVIALGNVIAVNVHLAFQKELWRLARFFLGIITFPIVLVSIFFVLDYANSMTPSVLLFPHLPLETISLVLVVCGVFLGIGVAASFRPKNKKKMRSTEDSIDNWIVSIQNDEVSLRPKNKKKMGNKEVR